MNIRQRVLRILGHQSGDRVAYDTRFAVPARARMIDHYGDPDFEAKLGNGFTRLQPHGPGEGFTEVEPDIWADGIGVDGGGHRLTFARHSR